MAYQSLMDLMNADAMQQAQLYGMGQEAKLRNLQMSQAERGVQEQEQLRSVLPQLMQGGDPQGMLKNLMASGNPAAIEFAGKIAPVLATMQKDTKATWQDRGDVLAQLDPYGQPTGVTMPKGAAPQQPLDIERVMSSRGLRPGTPQWNSALAEYQSKITTHAPASSVTYGAPVSGVDASGNPVFFQPTKAGGAPSIIPGVRPAPKESAHFTEGETKAATLLRRMEGSQAQLAQAAKDAAGKSDKPGLAATAARGIGLETLANVMDAPTRQRIEAAQLDILDAALTLGTGAAYTKEQLQGYKKAFFPQIGDDQATISDKQARLENVIEAGYIAAGRAAPKGGRKPTQLVKPRDIALVKNFLNAATTQDDLAKRVKSLKNKGWSDEEIKQAYGD